MFTESWHLAVAAVRDTLIRKLVSGELRVNEASKLIEVIL